MILQENWVREETLPVYNECLFGPPKLGRFVLSRDNKVENDVSTSLYPTIVQLPQESLIWSWIMYLEDRVRKKPELLLLFSRSVVSDSLRPPGLQHARLPCPSPAPGVAQTHVH